MKTLYFSVAVTGLLCGRPSFSQDQSAPVVQPIPVAEVVRSEQFADSTSDVWLGVALGRLEAPLRSQLGLGNDEGVLIVDVLPDGPAVKAGLKLYDVLVKVGETKIGSASELAAAVKANGTKAVTITLLRKGESKTVDITPAKRADQAVKMSAVLQEARLKDALNQARARLWAMEEGGGWKEVGPGVIVAKGEPKARSIAIRVEPDDAEPARITVERDGKTWTAKANELETLPADVRVLVLPHLGKGSTTRAIVIPQPRAITLKSMPVAGPKGNAEVLEQIRALRDLVVKQHAQLESRLDELESRDATSE